MPINSWMPEHVEALRVHVIANQLSYGEAARDINERFGTTHSRNACIGKAKRMGFVRGVDIPPRPPKEVKPKAPKKPRSERKRQGDHHTVLKIIAGGNGSTRVIRSRESADTIKLRCVEVVPLNLTLAELDQATQCHYIPGDDMLFCGQPILTGSVYCGPHHYLCLGYGTASERAASREVAA